MADEDYIAQCRAQGIYPIGYYPHNIHFLWSSSTMEGRSETAIAAARKVAGAGQRREHGPASPPGRLSRRALLRPDPLRALGRDAEGADAGRALRLRDGHLALRPGPGLRGQGTAGRCRDRARPGQEDRGRHRPRLHACSHPTRRPRSSPSPPRRWPGPSPSRGRTTTGRSPTSSARSASRTASSTPSRRNGTTRPARPSGAALLAAGRAHEAETVYWDDLRRNRENGWSLFGLSQALAAQGKKDEAAALDARFGKAWAKADVKIQASVF